MSPLAAWLRRNLTRGPKYQTNFEKTNLGNGLHYSSPLRVKIRGAEIVTGRVYDARTNKTYQIDQSSQNDEDKNAETIEFSLRTKLHPRAVMEDYYALPRGEYVLLIWWWDNDTMRGGTYRDKFVIV